MTCIQDIDLLVGLSPVNLGVLEKVPFLISLPSLGNVHLEKLQSCEDRLSEEENYTGIRQERDTLVRLC